MPSRTPRPHAHREPSPPATGATRLRIVLQRTPTPPRTTQLQHHAERTVMGVMGWSNTAMAARYQHLTATIRRDVAQRVGGLLWEPAGDASPELPTDDPAAGTADQMPPEMQTTGANARQNTIITPSVNAGQGWRKRRDSNPRSLAGRSLSRSSTPRSAVTTTAQWAGRPPCTVTPGSYRSRANATTNATTAVRHWDVRRPPVC
jgi:hypothetical protein